MPVSLKEIDACSGKRHRYPGSWLECVFCVVGLSPRAAIGEAVLGLGVGSQPGCVDSKAYPSLEACESNVRPVVRAIAGGGRIENLAMGSSWNVASLPWRKGDDGVVRCSEAHCEMHVTEDPLVGPLRPVG